MKNKMIFFESIKFPFTAIYSIFTRVYKFKKCEIKENFSQLNKKP